MKSIFLAIFALITLNSLTLQAGAVYQENNTTTLTGSKMKNKRVLISGAGISGLTLAYWLKQHGFIPTLIEKHQELRTGGYKIDIRGVAIDVIKLMDTYPAIYDARTDIQGATIIESGGKQSIKVDADLCGGRIEGDLEILRGDLCEILLQKIGDVECLFGDSITSISQDASGVYVEFEKNKPCKFDLVVGADGLHSTVRQLVFGPEPDFLKELGLYVSVYSIPNFLNLERWEIEYFEGHKFINVYSSHKDLSAKVGFAFPSASSNFDLKNKDEQQQILQKVFADVGWEVPRLLAAMQDATDFYFDSAAQIHLPHWSKGRVVLVGDAGYASSPLSGQGTSVALVGAYVLAGELAAAQGNHETAFSEYEKTLYKFVKKNQDLVQMNTDLMGENRDPNSLIAWMHNELIQLLPESIVIELWKKWGVKCINEAANNLELKNY